MLIRKVTVAVAALSMGVAPALAAPANPASSLSVAKSVRASAPSRNGSHLGNGAILPAVLALAIIAGGIYIAVDDNNNSKSR